MSVSINIPKACCHCAVLAHELTIMPKLTESVRICLLRVPHSNAVTRSQSPCREQAPAAVLIVQRSAFTCCLDIQLAIIKASFHLWLLSNALRTEFQQTVSVTDHECRDFRVHAHELRDNTAKRRIFSFSEWLWRWKRSSSSKAENHVSAPRMTQTWAARGSTIVAEKMSAGLHRPTATAHWCTLYILWQGSVEYRRSRYQGSSIEKASASRRCCRCTCPSYWHS